jgi:hypothetical protein
MNKERPQSCGFGAKRNFNFGAKRDFNFGARYESFYKDGSQKNTFLSPDVRQCLGNVYGSNNASYTSTSYPPDIITSLGFGKSKKKKVNSEMKYLRSFC